MFGVCNMFHLPGPAASTAAAYVALLGGRAITIGIHNRGPMSPGVAWSCVVLCVA